DDDALSEINEEEAAHYILTDEEIIAKDTFWAKDNADYLVQKAEKDHLAAKTKASMGGSSADGKGGGGEEDKRKRG
ncbi:unnamed protein product, partial [Phaeothamnion confervicola]